MSRKSIFQKIDSWLSCRYWSAAFTALHRRGLAMRILSVCPHVCLSNSWIMTKRKKVVPAFLYPMKEHLL